MYMVNMRLMQNLIFNYGGNLSEERFPSISFKRLLVVFYPRLLLFYQLCAKIGADDFQNIKLLPVM